MAKKQTTIDEIKKQLDRIEYNLNLASWLAALVFGFAVMFGFMQLYDTHGDPTYMILTIGAFIGAMISFWRVKALQKEFKEHKK